MSFLRIAVSFSQGTFGGISVNKAEQNCRTLEHSRERLIFFEFFVLSREKMFLRHHEFGCVMRSNDAENRFSSLKNPSTPPGNENPKTEIIKNVAKNRFSPEKPSHPPANVYRKIDLNNEEHVYPKMRLYTTVKGIFFQSWGLGRHDGF